MRRTARARGIALPVMLIMLAVMMISTVYLLRSTNSTTMAASNLAYEDALSKAADLGVHQAHQWLASRVNRNELWADVPGAGYVATANPDPAQGVSNPAFWQGSVKIPPGDGNPNTVEYVIHRLCKLPGAYNANGNNCVQAPASKTGANSLVGQSLSSNAPAYAGIPRLHYVITTRISGPRGGNVMNQAVVLMGP